MPTTALIPATLDVSLADFRARVLGELGAIGLPNQHWGLDDLTTNDCLGFLTWAAGLRARDEYPTALIKISAFRASAGWQQVAPSELRSGDWAFYNWDTDPDADHVEFLYGIDRVHGETDTVAANTGPRPGVTDPRGVYRKTRPIDAHLIGGIRPPYRVPVATSAEIRTVRTAATYLDRVMPATILDEATGRTITLHRSDAGDHDGIRGDGKRGPLYRLLAQAWGRQHGIYGLAYRLDGIFGPRCETAVEPALFAAARAAAR